MSPEQLPKAKTMAERRLERERERKREEKLLTEPTYLDISSGSDFLGALMPSLRVILMPDGTLRWVQCDIPMGPTMYPTEGAPVNYKSDSEAAT